MDFIGKSEIVEKMICRSLGRIDKMEFFGGKSAKVQKMICRSAGGIVVCG